MNIENLEKILLYNYEEELKHLQEEYDIPEELNKAIEYCEEHNINHIAYNLMILQRDLDFIKVNNLKIVYE